MPFLKSISGHTRCAHRIQDYLDHGSAPKGAQAYVDRNGRALGHDFFNLTKAEQKDWAKTMDRTRSAYGNDREWQGWKAVTYRHFIISPSPEDHVSLDTLRDLACTWVEENFPEFEVAITYHDDNANHIPHAHIIVNNTNLVTKRRLHLDDKETRAIADSLQTLAMQRGLKHFENVDGEEIHPENVHPLAEYIRKTAQVNRTFRDRRPSAQREYLSKSERGLVESGKPCWKQDIRDKVLAAMWISDGTKETFALMLAKLGVQADFREGDILFTVIGEETRKVTSSRLGTDYGLEGLARICGIAQARMKLSAERRDGLANRIVDIQSASLGMDYAELDRKMQDEGLTLRSIRLALDTLSSNKITSIATAESMQRQAPSDTLAEAIRVAKILDVLPEYSQKELAARQEGAAAGEKMKRIPLEVRVRKGMRLTKAEYISLDTQQKLIWDKARRAAAEKQKSTRIDATKPAQPAQRSSGDTQTKSQNQARGR